MSIDLDKMIEYASAKELLLVPAVASFIAYCHEAKTNDGDEYKTEFRMLSRMAEMRKSLTAGQRDILRNHWEQCDAQRN